MLAAAVAGGWEWAVPCVGLAVWMPRPLAWRAAVAAIAPGLCWLAAYGATGDRRLYFCYFLQYAVHLACVRGVGAGVAGAALFLAIRVLQGASASVLAVEAVVALVVVPVMGRVHAASGSEGDWRRMVVSAVGSLMAFACLTL